MMGSNEILALYQRDEKRAIKLLFDLYYEPLLLYASRLMGDTEGVEDIVQECFVHVWSSRRLANFSGNLDSFMFQAVKFRVINYLRDRRRRLQLYEKIREEETNDPIVWEEEESKAIELLYVEISHLPEECRKIFLMACLDGLKYREIANILQISINTVKTQMKIALRFLREHLDKDAFSSILLFFTFNCND